MTPPRDIHGGSEGEELLARVIPLRRRGEPTAEPLTPLWGVFDLPGESDGPELVERSVWDRPATELRLRQPLRPPAERRTALTASAPVGGGRLTSRLALGATLLAVAMVGVVMVVLVPGRGRQPQLKASSALPSPLAVKGHSLSDAPRSLSRPRRHSVGHAVLASHRSQRHQPQAVGQTLYSGEIASSAPIVVVSYRAPAPAPPASTTSSPAVAQSLTRAPVSPPSHPSAGAAREFSFESP